MRKALIFDLDHTFYDYPSCNSAGQAALFVFLSKRLKVSRRRVTILFNQARQRIHTQLPTQAASHSRLLYSQDTIETIRGCTDVRLTLQAEAIFWKAYLAKMRLRPGTRQLLRQARRQGLRIVVASDLTTAIQLRKLLRLHLAQYIDYVVTSEEVGIEKPDPTMLQVAVKKCGCRTNEVVYIGDSISRDGIAARRLGIPFHLVDSNHAMQRLARDLFES